MGEDEYASRLQSWLDRLRAGEDPQGARDEVINHSCERLRRLARRMLRGYPRLQRWEQCDDVLQESLLRLHRSLEHVQPDSVAGFFGLAATQIRRTLIDLARRHFGPEGAGAYTHKDVYDAKVTPCACEPSTLPEWVGFYEILDALPGEEREVVNLLWFEGLTQQEAALVLGVSERTVRRRWYSARYLLYRALAKERHE